MPKSKRRPLTGMGADAFFGTSTEEKETPSDSETGGRLDSRKEESSGVTKTSFYPRQDQLDKLDDLASEYNKRYRRQRRRIDRQDIVRYLIDQCDLETLADLQL